MKKFSKILVAVLAVILVSSCAQRDNGQLVGVLDRPTWKGINPYGMVYIPSGTLHIGPSDQDVNHTLVQRPKSISMPTCLRPLIMVTIEIKKPTKNM